TALWVRSPLLPPSAFFLSSFLAFTPPLLPHSLFSILYPVVTLFMRAPSLLISLQQLRHAPFLSLSLTLSLSLSVSLSLSLSLLPRCWRGLLHVMFDALHGYIMQRTVPICMLLNKRLPLSLS